MRNDDVPEQCGTASAWEHTTTLVIEVPA